MIVFLYGMLVFVVLFIIIGFFSCGIFNKNEMVSLSWVSPYECGFASQSLSLNYFSFNCFSLLVFFVIFDLEISLLLNMPSQGLLYDNFYYYYLFLAILAISFFLEILIGYVRWGY